MIVTAWKNGKCDQRYLSYGFRVTRKDRSYFFKQEWKNVCLKLNNASDYVIININKKSFWDNTCGELINCRIKNWLIERGCASWEYGDPPKFELTPIHDYYFFLDGPAK